MRILIAFFAALVLAGPAIAASHADDRYVGYYYPEIGSVETFDRELKSPPTAGKDIRVNFVTAITKAQLEAPESPRFVLFTKGSEGQRLIIIALDDEVFRSLYRARALMAQLTSNIRGTAFFRDQNLDVAGTFYDMLQILQFDSLVISDGTTWSHKVNFVRN